MTKAIPTRSSTRILIKKQKTTEIAKAPTKQQSLLRRTNKIIKKWNVVRIRDFKRQSGKMMYLVQRDGPNDDAWEHENMIENSEILAEYQQMVLNESGYSIIIGDQQGQQRHPRSSKTRAVIALKQSEFGDMNEDDNETSRIGNRARRISNKTSATKISIKKTKAQLFLDNQVAERLGRMNMRSTLNVEEIMEHSNCLSRKECCLKCGANVYREALENDDLNRLKTALNDNSITSHSYEDKVNGLDFNQYAILLKKPDFIKVVKDHYKESSSTNYPEVPKKYTKYDGGNTGRNVRMGLYNNRNFRRVEESRGNRVGNSVFYKDGNSKKTFGNLENYIEESWFGPFLPYVSKDLFCDKKVISNCIDHFEPGSRDVYYAATSGNRKLTSYILASIINDGRRSTFNSLHKEVLEDGKTLSDYKKRQVLKMASDAFNVTPYHLSAINPSAVYLSELYEKLDPAERLDTDAFGRSVAFFAAVSETSDCLRFLESKGFNLSLVDKYKISPLIQAARFGRSHNVEILIKHLRGGPEVTTTSPFVFQTAVRNKRTSLHYAAFFGHAKTCAILIKYDAPVECIENLEKQTPLIFAAKNGHLDCVRVLIEEGKANPEKNDRFSRTALHYACMNGHINIVQYLLSIGVDANVLDSSSNSPIHFAAAFGYINILHLLVEYGSADPSVCNVWRSTPCSVANMKGHIGIVKYLLSLPNNTIDVNFKDQTGCIMLQHTIGEPVNTHLEKQTNIEKARLLLTMKANVNSTDIKGETSLHTLVSDVSYSKLLPKDWETPCLNPSLYYRPNPIKHDDIEGVDYQNTLVNLLVEHGANLNAKSLSNETPLAMAMRLKNHHLVATLIKLGSRFWTDVDKNRNNFFHYFGEYAGFINGLQPHNELDIIVKERHINNAKQMWESVELNSVNHMIDIERILNLPNNQGITPLYFGVLSAIRYQKEGMIREKKLIFSGIESSQNNGPRLFGTPSYNDHLNSNNKERNLDKATLPLAVSLQFDFKLWIELMDPMVTKFRPRMNEVVGLPRNFKKKNPKFTKKDYPPLTGYTAIHIAAETQCVDLIQFLLEQGCNPNVKVQLDEEILSGDTPFIIAYHLKKDCHQELPDQSLESAEKLKIGFNISKPDFKNMLHQTVKTLIQFNACPFIINTSKISPVMNASAILDNINIAEMCKIRCSSDADIDQLNEEDKTALMIAVESISNNISQEKCYTFSIIENLLKAGSNPNMYYENGDSILVKIIRTASLPLLQTFLQSSIVVIDHDLKTKKLENSLIIVCKSNVLDLVSYYLQYLKKASISCDINSLDNEGNSALSYAAKNGNLQAVNELLVLGANPNCNDGRHIPLFEATHSQNIDVVELLLKYGASVNDKDETTGNSALHNSILTGKHKISKLLLENGADFELINLRKQTPMHLAIETTKKQTNRSFRVERLLIKAGANANAVDFFGRTPLHYVFVDSELIPVTRTTGILCKKVKKIAKEIQAKQEKIRCLNDYAHTFNLDQVPEVSNDGVNSLSAWMTGAKEIQLNEAASKEKNGKSQLDDVIVLDEEKDSLTLYCNYKWESSSKDLLRSDPIDILNCLSDFKGLQFDIKDEFGRTPLHYAACVGAFTCTSLLIKNNVDINATDSDNNGPLQLALRSNFVDYSVMLCNYGATVNNDIVLKNGKSVSTFGFSLSQSLINMAYLAIDNGITLMESIKDALKNGKFHMVEILLGSAQDYDLSQKLPDGQNIWHVVSNFKPFNMEIWEEYVEDIIERFLPLNLSICLDVYHRSPISYAAEHGQSLILKQLISMDKTQIQAIDKAGKVPIDYAVDSKNLACVKELLIAGASVINTNGFQKSSLILKSVQADTHDITEILLQYNSPVNEDSSYGRISPIMVACQKKDLKLLNLLISSGANVNDPCYVERADDTGKKYTVLLYPIFAASYPKSLLLEDMLKAGANPNVNGPDSKPEFGRSCFMYNVSLDSVENQQTLLKYDIDLNAVDSKSCRTVFYQFFFGKMKYKGFSKDNNSDDNDRLNFHDAIFEKMLKSFKPNVNIVDKITGMTPLELAIIEKNTIITEHLLLLGADINIKSSNITDYLASSNMMNPSRKPIPAILHAIMQNNLDILDLICKKTLNKVDWSWSDEENRNIFSYLAGCNGGFSYENISLIRYISAKVEYTTLQILLKMRDIYDMSPVCYAFERKNVLLYDALRSLIISPEVIKLKKPRNNNNLSMEIDFISTQKVDQDAQIEREILQKEKDLKKTKNSLVTFDDCDLAVKVDTYSKLEKVGYVQMDEKNEPYDIMLIKVELPYYGTYIDTWFYKMSIIYNKVLNINILWTRWGKHGDEGQHQKTPFLNLEEAVIEFKKIFKSKTANLWENCRTTFVQKQNSYGVLKKFNYPKDNILQDFDFLNSTLPTHLPLEVSNTMKLICNFTYLSRVYSDTSIDIPLGQVPQKTIEEAQKLLKNVKDMSAKLIEAKGHPHDKAKIVEVKTLEFKISQECLEYARLLPRSGENNMPARRLLDDRYRNFMKEWSRVDDLSYVSFAANVILAAKLHLDNINPFQYVYQTLNCSLKPVSCSLEYQMINNYMQSTSNGSHELVHLLAVNRIEEEDRFAPFEKESDRKLLWHGSRVGNVMGILKQGLRIKPQTSSSNGAMLGDGIYFADTFVKSLNYSSEDYGSHQSNYKILLLCEVALGSKTAVYENHLSLNNTDELHSMKGEGSNIPDPCKALYNKDGVCIPIGPCITFSRSVSTTNQPSLLGFNEFAVYNAHRVKIRYLLIIQESTKCYLCSKSNRDKLKPLHQHDVKNYNFSAFNPFESEVIKAYLSYEKKSPQDIFEQELNNFIDTGEYKKKWNVPLDLARESKVCNICALDVVAILLSKRMTSSTTDIPESLKANQYCRYGHECRSQIKVNHAKKYQHWLAEKKDESAILKNTESEPNLEPCNEDEESYSGNTEDEDPMDTDDE